MTFHQELKSWMSPTALEISPVPSTGSKAPSSEQLRFPREDGKAVIVTFLRHCGCPFAERTLLHLRHLSTLHPQYHYIAISHSSPTSTTTWLDSINDTTAANRPSNSNVEVIVDESRELYAQWGLGVASTWHVLNPMSMLNVWKLGREEGIWNRPTESGSRWQVGGSWAVDGRGVVRWGGSNGRADEEVRFEEAVEALRASGGEGMK